MNEGQKRSTPGLHEHHAAVFSQHALHFGKGLIQIAGQIWQMMQAALNDEYIFAAFRKRKFPAVGNNAFRGAFVLGNEPGRKVYPFEACESQTLQRDQPVPASAKKLDNLRTPRPLSSAQPLKAANKLPCSLFRRFETQVSAF